MTFEEFFAVYNAYITQRNSDFKDRWERMRVQSTIYVQMHLAKGKKISAKELVPLPWDKEEKHIDTRTPEEQRARTAELMRRAGYKTEENKD